MQTTRDYEVLTPDQRSVAQCQLLEKLVIEQQNQSDKLKSINIILAILFVLFIIGLIITGCS